MASKEADMYAFGMVVYEVIMGSIPFDAATSLPKFAFQSSGPPRPEDPVGIGFGKGTWEFIEKCWDKDPERRPTAREALEHFGCAARTSTVVDPGAMMPLRKLVHCRSEGSPEIFVSVVSRSVMFPARSWSHSSTYLRLSCQTSNNRIL
jgi:serine/threonine protein kinase